MSIEHVTGEYLNGFHLKPENQTSRGTIVTFGGSEGSPDFATARRLAEAGYDTYALFFFGMTNQQPMLSQVPLESFEEVISQVAATNDGGPLTVMGTSKGAEYAANAATRYADDIDNLILIAPSAYSFPGLGREQNVSSWTWQGADVEMISLHAAGFGPTASMLTQLMLAFPVAYEPVYTAAVAGTDDPEAARIPIEDFDGKILAIAGGSDRMWASAQYAELIAAHHPDTELSIHPDAGHVFGAPPQLRVGQMVIDSGGSQAANEKALKGANQDLSRALQEWHEHS
ncbi:alpha/beta hydrolase family protein [Brevibacterium luteolum]|uniref:alpha/beta hydrolase family protein n=1 Tax=Brevibacterium luteolum TaxID=199591 RepID=UPI003879D859